MRSSWTSKTDAPIGAVCTFQSAFMRSSWTSVMDAGEAALLVFQSAFMRSSWTSGIHDRYSPDPCFNPPSCGQAGPAGKTYQWRGSSWFQSAFMRSSWTSEKAKDSSGNDVFQSAFMRSSWTSREVGPLGRGPGFNPPSCGQAGPAHLLQSFDIG